MPTDTHSAVDEAEYGGLCQETPQLPSFKADLQSPPQLSRPSGATENISLDQTGCLMVDCCSSFWHCQFPATRRLHALAYGHTRSASSTSPLPPFRHPDASASNRSGPTATRACHACLQVYRGEWRHSFDGPLYRGMSHPSTSESLRHRSSVLKCAGTSAPKSRSTLSAHESGAC